MASTTTASTFVPVVKDGSIELGQVICTVSPGTPALVLPNRESQTADELAENLQQIYLSLPSSRIVVETDRVGLSVGTEGVELACVMVVLAAIGAIPTDQVEHAVFNARVKSGETRSLGIDPLDVSVIAAEADLVHWCSAEDGEGAGLVGNCRAFAAGGLFQILDHCLGRRLIEPSQTRLRCIEDLCRNGAAADQRSTPAFLGQHPTLDIGGVACMVRDGQVFALHLDSHGQL